MSDLPAGMVSIGEAMAGFLTELEERCKLHAASVPYGTFRGKMEGAGQGKAPAMLQTSGSVNDYVGVANE